MTTKNIAYGYGETICTGDAIDLLKNIRKLIEREIDATETYTRKSSELHKQIDAIDSSISHMKNARKLSLLLESFK